MADPYPLEEKLREQMCEALTSMGLNPFDIPQHGVLELRENLPDNASPESSTWTIEFDEFVRDENGHAIFNKDTEYAEVVRRRVRLPKHPKEYGWPM